MSLLILSKIKKTMNEINNIICLAIVACILSACRTRVIVVMDDTGQSAMDKGHIMKSGQQSEKFGNHSNRYSSQINQSGKHSS